MESYPASDLLLGNIVLYQGHMHLLSKDGNVIIVDNSYLKENVLLINI
jgi:hypothetical protein